jgi:hypothetical protein
MEQGQKWYLASRLPYNILRKRKPDVFAKADAKGIAAYVVQPLRLAIPV